MTTTKYLIVALLIFASSTFLLSQSAITDSLDAAYNRKDYDRILSLTNYPQNASKDKVIATYFNLMNCKAFYKKSNIKNAWSEIELAHKNIQTLDPKTPFEIAMYMEICQRYGDIGFLMVKHGESAEVLQKGIELGLSQESLNYDNLGRLFHKQGANYRANGQFEKSKISLDWILNHVDSFSVDRKDLLRMSALSEMAQLNNDQKKYQKAIDTYQDMIEIAKADSNYHRLNVYYNNLGIAYYGQGNFVLSDNSFREAIHYGSKHLGSESVELGSEYGNLAYINNLLGRYDLAEIYAYEEYRRISNVFDTVNLGYADHLRRKGHYAKFRNEYERSNEIFLRALTISKNEGRGPSALKYELLTSIGENHISLKNYDQAKKYFNQALEIKNGLSNQADADLGIIYRSLAQIGLNAGELKDTKKYIFKAYETEGYDYENRLKFDKITNPTTALTIMEVDLLYNLEKYKTTKESSYLERVKEIINAADALMIIDKEQRNENVSRGFAFSSTQRIYEAILDYHFLLYEKEASEEMAAKIFSIFEKSSNMFLYQYVNEKDTRSFGVPHNIIVKKARLSDSIKIIQTALESLEFQGDDLESLNDQLTRKNDDLLELNNEIKNKYPSYYQNIVHPTYVQLSEFMKTLEKDEIVIAYFLGYRSIYAYYLSADETIIERKPIEPDFLNTLKDFIFKLSNGESYDSYITTLSDKLINNDLIQNYRKVIIFPDDELGALPFELLQCGNDIMLNTHDIQYNYSATMEAKTYKKKPGLKEYGFAPFSQHPLSIDSTLVYSPLAQSEQELLNMKNEVGGNYYLDNLASESKFKSIVKDASIIHLATHGLSDNVSPEFSAVYFSTTQDSLNDGSLYGYEIINLDMNPELVVLSACNTGVGKSTGGIGLTTLGKSFAYAGAKSELVSLWPVNDASTQKIISIFYENLRSGMTKPKALQNAKLKYISESPAKLSHPYYWAGLVLYGNDSAIYSGMNKWLYLGGIVLLLGILILFMRRNLIKVTD